MSDSDDEDEVFILRGEHRETFSKEDANNALKVKGRFGLDHEPACVFKVSKKKVRVNFGNLQSEKTYKLEDEEQIPNQKLHTQNAAIMSVAAYKSQNEDPSEYLSDTSASHTIKAVVAVSEHSEQGVVLAVGTVDNTNTLYVAFRGTATLKDGIDDGDIEMKEKGDIPGGKYHAGFSARRKTAPMKQILYCAQEEDCNTIVACGHSLGGAVSSIVALDLMMHLGKESELVVHNITFGAPLFANETVREACRREGLDRRILHHVGHQDIVPGILSLGHSINEVKKRAKSALNSATGGLYEGFDQHFHKYMVASAKVASFVLQNVPWGGDGDFKDNMQTIGKLGDKILSGVKTTELGQRYSRDEFVPIGNFYIIENENVSILKAEKITAQVQELILKDPIRRTDTMKDITDGHGLQSYYIPWLQKINKVSFESKRSVDSKNLLKPTQDEASPASLVTMKREKGGFGCYLVVTGSFLENVQVGATENDFQGLPFKRSSTVEVKLANNDEEIMMIGDHYTEEESIALAERSLFTLQIATTFGKMTVKVRAETATSALPTSSADMKLEPVSSLLEKSIIRSLTMNKMKTHSTEDQDALKANLDMIFNQLGLKQEFSRFSKEEDPFENNDAIKKFVTKILEEVTRDITDSAPGTPVSPGFASFINNPLAVIQDMLPYMPLTSYVLSNLGLNLMQQNETENDYSQQLSKITKMMMWNRDALKLSYDSDVVKFQLELLETNLTETKRVSLKEQMLRHLVRRRAKLSRKESAKVLQHLETQIKHNVEKMVKIFIAIQLLREIYSTQCFIGFVGPQNSGKSTLMSKLFNVDAKTGMRDHTDKPTLYPVVKNIYAVDFPGSDSLFTHKERFAEFGMMNNLMVYVMPYNGTPNESIVENVKTAYGMQRKTGQSAKTIFCMNKAAREEGKFDEEYTKQFVQMIKDDIAKKDWNPDAGIWRKVKGQFKGKEAKEMASQTYDDVQRECQKLKDYTLSALSEEDFIFTDWMQPDAARGIKGPEDVKEIVKRYLADSKINNLDGL